MVTCFIAANPARGAIDPPAAQRRAVPVARGAPFDRFLGVAPMDIEADIEADSEANPNGPVDADRIPARHVNKSVEKMCSI